MLLELVKATEDEAMVERWGVAPWYYEQLAILYRKRRDPLREVEILERFARQEHAGGVMPPELLARLATTSVPPESFASTVARSRARFAGSLSSYPTTIVLLMPGSIVDALKTGWARRRPHSSPRPRGRGRAPASTFRGA